MNKAALKTLEPEFEPEIAQDHPARNGNSLSPLMDAALRHLGGRKCWRGHVRGLAGLINRKVEIMSEGVLVEDRLHFRETLKFDNGDEEQRQWQVRETQKGLVLEADNVALLEPGKLHGPNLVFRYRVRFGNMNFDYFDIFRELPDGQIENKGVARKFGIKIFDVYVVAETMPA